MGAAATVVTLFVAMLLVTGSPAHAAVVAPVGLATSANYSVLAGSTVTNTGLSVLGASVGLWPGGSITGFPPGLVLPPGTTDTTNAAAQQAQSDLTVAYVDAAGRPVDGTTTADLVSLKLQAGVYSGPNKSPLSLSGPLVLDGAGNLNSVFIFQTESTLITGSGSTVQLINGAQECNVFWQVGSSATLGTGSTFVGNILALTSITVNNSVTVHGRALARNGAVTLDNDTFTKPSCAQPADGDTDNGAPATTSTTTTSTTTTSTTTTSTTTTSTTIPATTTSPIDDGSGPTAGAGSGTETGGSGTESGGSETAAGGSETAMAGSATGSGGSGTGTGGSGTGTLDSGTGTGTGTSGSGSGTGGGSGSASATAADESRTAASASRSRMGTATQVLGSPGSTSSAGSAGAPGIPGVVGPPRTGGAPLEAQPSLWVTVLFVALSASAATVGILRYRRVDTYPSKPVGS